MKNGTPLPSGVFRAARVLVPSDDGGWDLRDARRFGTLEAITRVSSAYPDDAEEVVRHVTAEAHRRFAGFNSDTDSVVLIGDPLILSAVIAVAASLFSRVAVLKWDRATRTYYRVIIDVSNHRGTGEHHVQGQHKAQG